MFEFSGASSLDVECPIAIKLNNFFSHRSVVVFPNLVTIKRRMHTCHIY